MREYVVQPGDSPASIASRPHMAGCPKCGGIDFVRANPHKAAVVHPNGFTTFKELRVGEKINLPDKWFDGTLDRMPPEYFRRLPHPDGVTGVSGTLGDAASDAVSALAQLDDRTFSYGVAPAAALIDQSVSAADGSANPGIAAYASATHIGTNAARRRNEDLVQAMSAGDKAAAAQARLDIQNALLTAVASAGLAVQASPSVLVDIGPATIDPSFRTAAQAAVAAISADPNFCTNVAHAGSAVNTAVHAFKTAWNAANPGNPVPINTGTYDQATAAVLTQILGSAPPACASRAPAPVPLPSPLPLPGITPPQSQPRSGLGVGSIVGMSVLGAGAVGGAIYLATRKPRRRVRRVSA